MSDTIAAISTSMGVSGIAIIRVSGNDSINIVNKIFKGKNLNEVETHTINYGYIVDNNNEIDAVVEIDGKKVAIEIKLNANQIDNAAKNLISINKKISSKNNNKGFDALCVICGMQDFAYKRRWSVCCSYNCFEKLEKSVLD